MYDHWPAYLLLRISETKVITLKIFVFPESFGPTIKVKRLSKFISESAFEKERKFFRLRDLIFNYA